MPMSASTRTTVAAAGTRVQLTSTATPCSWVFVTALSANAGQINVGDSGVVAAAGATERGTPLAAGASVTLPISDASKLWLDSRVNGDGATWAYGAG